MSTTETQEPRPSVTLPQGTVIGIRESGVFPGLVETFKGIPYALQPIASRRFRPPVKVRPSTDVIDASKFGPRAPARQFIVMGPELEESESCLTINIFRPPGANDSSKLPVALYLHGGAFNRGSASMHDTASMVGWSQKPFIGVSFGYRIGALGFLPSTLSAEEGVLNLGLKDQICAMEWVQDNIGFFGGNKGNVTLFGLSAGAHSIGHHLLNYHHGVPPLFHRVIMESGAPTSRAVRHWNAEIHEQQFEDFLTAVQCPKGLSGTQVYEYLRSLPGSVIWEAQTNVFAKYNPSLRWAFQPVIDGEIIQRRPIDAWREGRWHKVPILTGFTTNEGSLYVDKKMSTSEEFITFWKNLLPQLTEKDLETIDSLYPDPSKITDSIYKEDRANVGPMYKRIEASYAHYAYSAPARQTAHFASNDVPVYLYHWALEGSVIDGARHGDQMYYEMRDPQKTDISITQDELSATVHAYWTNFICTGDPNGLPSVQDRARPAWAKYDVKSPKILIFGEKNKELVGGSSGPTAVLEDDTWGARESDFWWSKVEISQQ